MDKSDLCFLLTPGQLPAVSSAPAAPTGGIDARWVLDFAHLTGLTFVAESDAKPIAASIALVKDMLAEARARLAAGVEPPLRSAPA